MHLLAVFPIATLHTHVTPIWAAMWGNEEKSLVTEEVKKCLKRYCYSAIHQKDINFYYQLNNWGLWFTSTSGHDWCTECARVNHACTNLVWKMINLINSMLFFKLAAISQQTLSITFFGILTKKWSKISLPESTFNGQHLDSMILCLPVKN